MSVLLSSDGLDLSSPGQDAALEWGNSGFCTSAVTSLNFSAQAEQGLQLFLSRWSLLSPRPPWLPQPKQ